MFDQLIGENTTALGGVLAFMLGAGVRVMDRFLKKQSDDESVATQLRSELREDLKYSEQRIEDLEEEVTSWRSKYWNEFEAHSLTKAELARIKGFQSEQTEAEGGNE